MLADQVQADHYIIRKTPPSPEGSREKFIDEVLTANGYSHGQATVDFDIDPTALDQASVVRLLEVYATKYDVDTGKCMLHNFRGSASGKLIAVYHKPKPGLNARPEKRKVAHFQSARTMTLRPAAIAGPLQRPRHEKSAEALARRERPTFAARLTAIAAVGALCIVLAETVAHP